MNLSTKLMIRVKTGNAMSINENLKVTDVPLDEIDVSRPEIFLNDSWQPWFERLRKEAPVHYLADSVNGPFWSISSHDMIKAVDTNNEIFSSEAKGIAIVDPYVAEEGQMQGKNFIAMDGSEHIKQRMAVAPTVAPKNLSGFEPLIRARASEILDHLPVGETFNWVDRVSIELTAGMLATLFDFPYEDRLKLVRWSDLATNVPEVTGDDSIDMKARYDELMGAAAAFYQLWMAKQGQPPSFDLISMLQHNETTARMNEDPELFLGNLLLLIVGGNDTTRNSISGGVLALNQYPDQYQKLRENPGLIPNMVAEMVRWQTPVIHMRRTALTDFELGGKQIKAGDKVIMWYLSGNRDEAVFENPEQFVIDRPNARAHVAFGFGVHRCMGNRLAELQLRVLWEEIMKRFDRVEIVGDIQRLPNNFIRGIKEVPVRLHSH